MTPRKSTSRRHRILILLNRFYRVPITERVVSKAFSVQSTFHVWMFGLNYPDALLKESSGLSAQPLSHHMPVFSPSSSRHYRRQWSGVLDGMECLQL